MPPKAEKTNRPQIWADGRQSPPFDFRAFARASYLYGREGMSGLLGRCSRSANSTAEVVAGGAWRVPEARLGRTGRYLPSHQSVSRVIAYTSQLLSRAAGSLDPRPAAIAEPSLFAVAAHPAEAPSAQRAGLGAPKQRKSGAIPTTAPSDPDLAVIRAMIAEAPSLQASTKEDTGFSLPVQTAPAEKAPSKLAMWLGESLTSVTGLLLGYGLLVVSLPYGAFKAALAHLNGEDLRSLEL